VLVPASAVGLVDPLCLCCLLLLLLPLLLSGKAEPLEGLLRSFINERCPDQNPPSALVSLEERKISCYRDPHAACCTRGTPHAVEMLDSAHLRRLQTVQALWTVKGRSAQKCVCDSLRQDFRCYLRGVCPFF